MLEPQNKRRQGRVLHQVLELQVRECTTEANGLVGLPGNDRRTQGT